MAQQNTNIYNEASIQILEGLEAVRKRPAMYIGSTDNHGMHHLAWEIVDNAIDEALAGFCSQITVTINKDRSVTIEDNGRGVPIGKHKSGKSTPEVIYTVLHAGGKFDGNSYKTSGGLHGVGASVVNALSKHLDVTIYRDKKISEIKFINGGKVSKPLKAKGTTKKTGTVVTFLPDFEKIFYGCDWNYHSFEQHLRESAFLINNLVIKLIDKRTNKEAEFHYDNGLTAFIEYLNEKKTKISPIVSLKGKQNQIDVDIVMQYCEDYNDTILGFANNVKTSDGGSHLVGFKSGLTKAINEYARKQELLKPKDKNLEGNDLREGLVAIVSLRVPENLIQYEGQTKSKLGTPEARVAVETIVSERLSFWLHEQAEVAEKIIAKAIKARDIRAALRKTKENLRNKTKEAQRFLITKLTPPQKHNPQRNELFLVEGDSAGGSAKTARNRQFQAILSLKGKVINALKSNTESLFNNDEINMIIAAVGAGVGNEFNLEDINYHKVIIMTDADSDGAHIQLLLLTFFYRFMRDLITSGNLYLALPPLFKITYENTKGEHEYFWTENDLKIRLESSNLKKVRYNIQRYKGLGEMNSDQLWETTMNPETRKLIKVQIEDAVAAEEEFKILMGDNVELRKAWIEKNISFEAEDLN
ncbi:DNA topoisomerase IV subunit B [Spiroplasma platyhelix]|uniref:DNA topoisomerase (ATP-hydrolyzing) n=1 Tax=Spiroplasma platyhelix PALS-1 TaxID=1276218 RepID=A0A846TSA4_9MOLU|nr:DNA topoisomerase 4 subunit B [Spiroplasma platyhelix PALS-1]NKE38385.1 DNA topoisomerase IV subunit B [Spiroplasma platyhelix PALS-1]UJB29271.1 DNA topoisomerase IV subunit B [Spiroplasma platyhelix PALS-1]